MVSCMLSCNLINSSKRHLFPMEHTCRARTGASCGTLRFLYHRSGNNMPIASVLGDMDTEIAALKKRRDKTHAIKQGMMQQLLTGRVRLIQPEMAPEQVAGP